MRGADPVSARSVSSENGHASEGWWMCATSLVRGEAIFSRHVQKNAVCRAASQELFGQENTLGVHRHAVTIRVSFSVSEIRSPTLTTVGFGKRNPLGCVRAFRAPGIREPIKPPPLPDVFSIYEFPRINTARGNR